MYKETTEPKMTQYLTLKEIHKICYENNIKNVCRKTKQKLLEELGIDPEKVAKPPRSSSIPVRFTDLTTMNEVTDFENICRWAKKLFLDNAIIRWYLQESRKKGEPVKFSDPKGIGKFTIECIQKSDISYSG